MYNQRILPFYMTYPLPLYYQEEDTAMRDLEYLQQMYPIEAKKYQKVVASMLDKLDYEGSMIYDEYPDKWQMYRLSQNILDVIRKQEEDARPVRLLRKRNWIRFQMWCRLFFAMKFIREDIIGAIAVF